MTKYDDVRCSRKSAANKHVTNEDKSIAVNSAKKPDEAFRDLMELEYRMHSPWKDRFLMFQDGIEEILRTLKNLSWFVVFGLLVLAFMIFMSGYSVMHMLGI